MSVSRFHQSVVQIQSAQTLMAVTTVHARLDFRLLMKVCWLVTATTAQVNVEQKHMNTFRSIALNEAVLCRSEPYFIGLVIIFFTCMLSDLKS